MNHQGPKGVGFVSNKHDPSRGRSLCACISHRITTDIHVVNDHQINYNCFNEPFAVSPYKSLYLDMHGLIFKTSISLLAGSTRLLCIRNQAFTRLPNPPERIPAKQSEISIRLRRNFCLRASSNSSKQIPKKSSSNSTSVSHPKLRVANLLESQNWISHPSKIGNRIFHLLIHNSCHIVRDLSFAS